MVGEVGQHPGGRTATAADDGRQFNNGFVRQFAAADAFGLQHAKEAAGVQIVDGVVGDAPQFLGTPQIYYRVRDELWANLAKWLGDGGAIPPDPKLARELNAPSWAMGLNARFKATPKSEIRSELGRSPDRADAVALAVWEPVVFRPERAGIAHDQPPAGV
jgi:hypothetical protein